MSLKRKYTKKNSVGKITVYHYVNDKLKGFLEPDPRDNRNKVKHYPLYVRILVKQQTTSFPSIVRNLYTPDSFEDQIANDLIIKEKLELEISNILNVINNLKPFEDKEFDIKTILPKLRESEQEVWEVLTEFLEHEMYTILNNFTRNHPILVPNATVSKNGSGTLHLSFTDKNYSDGWSEFLLTDNRSNLLLARDLVWALSNIIPEMEDLKKRHSRALWSASEIFYYVDKYYEQRKKVANTIADWESGAYKNDILTAFPDQQELIHSFVEEVDQILKHHKEYI